MASGVEVSAEAARRMDVAWQWIDEFLAQPNPELGRAGDVCPYVKRAVRGEHMVMRPFDVNAGEPALVDLVRQLREDMIERAAGLGADSIYATALVVPFGGSDRLTMEMLARVQSNLKPEFVERGLMIGEFWPNHIEPGLHNRDFRPLSSPLPMLALRHMVVNDLVFLTAARVPAAQQVEFLTSYRRLFDDQLTAQWRRRLDQAETSARATMGVDTGV